MQCNNNFEIKYNKCLITFWRGWKWWAAIEPIWQQQQGEFWHAKKIQLWYIQRFQFKRSIFDTYILKLMFFSEGSAWLSGSMQGWQPWGRWFKLSWGQSLFVGGNVRLGYVRLGGRDWVGAASFFFIIYFLT